MVGTEFGPFFIEKELGSGAMGAVYKARYLKNSQRVAIKVMNFAAGTNANSSLHARFEREAEILKNLNHGNIVRLFGVGRFKGMRYYAMELIDGETLEEIKKRKGQFSWEETIEIGIQVCSALQAAHDQNIVHRDLKLPNLMMTSSGVVKLTDFGIAKDLEGTALTSAHCAIGTAAYMSPEQCKGERDISFKSDLYSLGVVLFEMMTGRRPFRGENAMELFLHHVQSKVEKPSRVNTDIPIWFDTLILHLMEKKPEHRPASAAVVRTVLEEIREKMTKQVGAGEALVNTLPDETSQTSDRKKARKLLARLGKKKLTVRFFKTGWFVSLALAAVFGAFCLFLYFTFIKAPSAGSLFTQAQSLMAAGTRGSKDSAREGPLADFLKYYPKLDSEQAKQIKLWVEQVDIDQCEDLLRKYLRQTAKGYKFGAQEEVEGKAFEAINLETDGLMEDAKKAWGEIAKSQGKGKWGYMANNRLQLFANQPLFEKSWDALGGDIRLSGNEPKLLEKIQPAFLAYWTERFGDKALAIARYKAFREKLDKDTDRSAIFDPELRQAHLLAVRKVRELPASAKGDPEVERTNLINRELEKARAGLAGNQLLETRYTCLSLIALFKDQAGYKKQIDEARTILNRVAAQIKGGT